MKFKPDKTTRALILIMIALVLTAALVAKIYYGNINAKVDPRIKPARELYENYDAYAQKGNYYKIFALLDSIEMIYKSVPHYAASYEIGVLYNNRCAALLTLVLHKDSIERVFNPYHDFSDDSLLELSGNHAKRAIGIYENWAFRFAGKEMEEIGKTIKEEFFILGEQLEEKHLIARIEEIQISIEENKRRLSVAYSNLGLVNRLKEDYETALENYSKALELWSRNLNAENNINILLGKPVRKSNFITRLFPPSKDN